MKAKFKAEQKVLIKGEVKTIHVVTSAFVDGRVTARYQTKEDGAMLYDEADITVSKDGKLQRRKPTKLTIAHKRYETALGQAVPEAYKDDIRWINKQSKAKEAENADSIAESQDALNLLNVAREDYENVIGTVPSDDLTLEELKKAIKDQLEDDAKNEEVED